METPNPKPDSPEAQLPTPEDALKGAMGGLDIKTFLAGEPEPAAAPEAQKPAVPDETAQQLAAAEQRAKEAETRANAAEEKAVERAREHDRNWQTEHMNRLAAEAYMRGLQDTRSREEALAAQAQAQEFPQIDFDFEQAMEDPEKGKEAFLKSLQQASHWAVQQALGQAYPYFQYQQQHLALAEPIQKFLLDTALDRAEAGLKEKGFTDFGEYRADIKKGLEQRGADGIRMALEDPNVIQAAYGSMRIQKGQSFEVAAAPAPPVQTDVAPSVNSGETPDAKQVPPRLLPIWNKLKTELGVDGLPEPTRENLAKAGINFEG